VKIDIGEVLTRSWQITWKHKVLWLYGFVLTLVSFLLMPFVLVPALAPALPGRFGERMMDDPILILIIFAGFFLFMLLMYPVSALLNGALTVGVLRGEHSDENLSFMDTIRESYPFFWRVLGIMLLFAGGYLLVMLAFFALMVIISVVTLGLGMFCMMPISFLQYPATLVWYIWMEQSLAAVVVDKMSVMEAARHSWELFRKNIWLYVLFGLVLYFGLTMVAMIAMMPMMIPFMFLPFALESAEFGRTALVITGLGMLVFAPLYSVFQGGVMALMKAGWVITYLRLTRVPHEPQPVLQAAPA
jgi:hypothetical protein